jgi:hypothetical protein
LVMKKFSVKKLLKQLAVMNLNKLICPDQLQNIC